MLGASDFLQLDPGPFRSEQHGADCGLGGGIRSNRGHSKCIGTSGQQLRDAQGIQQDMDMGHVWVNIGH